MSGWSHADQSEYAASRRPWSVETLPTGTIPSRGRLSSSPAHRSSASDRLRPYPRHRVPALWRSIPGRNRQRCASLVAHSHQRESYGRWLHGFPGGTVSWERHAGRIRCLEGFLWWSIVRMPCTGTDRGKRTCDRDAALGIGLRNVGNQAAAAGP